MDAQEDPRDPSHGDRSHYAAHRGTDGWRAPSQSGSGSYMVDPEFGTCSCPDHETRNVVCKHLFAVRLTIRRERGMSGEVKVTREVEVKYTQQWSAYNAAQCEEKDRFLDLLSGLVETVNDPRERKLGRPSIPLSTMAFACTYKVYDGFSSRRFT